MINVIVAIAQNGIIGGGNTLLWHISEDLKNFKRITTGHPVIMGRKTYDSLGRPLPNRTNVVITRQEVEIEGCRVVHSLGEALSIFTAEQDVFIIGGGEIYAQAMELADRLYITRVHRDYQGDVSFPNYDTSLWELTSAQHFERGEKFEYPFTIEEYHTRSWSIRRAEKLDIPLIRSMASVSFVQTYKDLVSPEQMDYMMDMMYSQSNLEKQIEQGQIFYLMYDHSSRAVGYGSIEPHGEGWYHLEKLYLIPDVHGQGYGRVLFGHLLREIKRLCGGAPCRVELNVHRGNVAKEFYFKQGMQIARQGDYIIEGTDFIRPDYILFKEL